LIRYEDVLRVLKSQDQVSRWSRSGKNAIENLRNVDSIANHFETALRTLYKAELRKVGPNGSFLYGTKGEARQNLHGHVFVHGKDTDLDLAFSSCLKPQGFSWVIEYPEKKLLSPEGPTSIGYAWNDALIIVDLKRLKRQRLGRKTPTNNHQWTLESVSHEGCVVSALKVEDGHVVTPLEVIEIKMKPSNQFQSFQLLGRFSSTKVIGIDVKTGEEIIYPSKKAAWQKLTKSFNYSKSYDNFRILVNRDSQRIEEGSVSQRPVVFCDRFVMVGEETSIDLARKYVEELKSRAAKSREIRRRLWSRLSGTKQSLT
jgi:hypothetical protein